MPRSSGFARIAAQGPAFRWSLALGVLGVLVRCGYLRLLFPRGSRLLRGGQKFSIGDIIKIRHALEVQHIDDRVDEQRRIEVASDGLEAPRRSWPKWTSAPGRSKTWIESTGVGNPDTLREELKKNKGQEQLSPR